MTYQFFYKIYKMTNVFCKAENIFTLFNSITYGLFRPGCKVCISYQPRDFGGYYESAGKSFEEFIQSAPEGRYHGIERTYGAADVARLRGSVQIRHTLAERGANRLWELLHERDYVNSLGAMSGNQAMQQVRAGLEAIYLSGWQVAADANTAGAMYPDQSLYPANSGPELVRKINRTLQRADQIEHSEGGAGRDWFAPIVADAEAGFGGPLNVFEITKAYIEAGAAGIHFEDQLASEKKCGHLGGKVLIPTGQHIRHLNAARLAADVMGTPTLIVCRTDAESAKLLTSDIDERDRPFIDGDRTPEGFFRVRGGVEACIARCLNYAPYSDLMWWETSKPNLEQARIFAEAIHKEYPGKILAYNCSPASTGGPTSTTPTSPSSSASWAPWATNSSS